MKKNILFLVSVVIMSVNVYAQNNFWTNANTNDFRTELKDRVSIPTSYRTVSFNAEAFLNFASNARSMFSERQGNTLELVLPMPNGENERFTLEDSEIMHPELANKFPQLKTYSGKGIDDKTATIRITYSPYFGFSGMILSGKHSTVYIDPITKDNVFYMSYYRKELVQTSIDFQCYTDESSDGLINRVEDVQRVDALGDCNLRRYRLAQSCTGEYAQYHIAQAGGSTGNTAGDKAIVQAAMNVTMNRVNGIYQRDLGIIMQFVANNDLVIYLNAGSDPWNGEYNTTTAQTLDSQIGVNNYDIGHNFNTSGGGNAGCLDCVCLAVSQSGTHKGRGYTGRAAPIGDPFDIDYVAHEMGHQFGGYHTQSNQSCRSGSGATEVEPGSASTIMGYAGICSANVQNASDDYFAYVNIRDIVTSINFGNGSGCAELIVSNNSGPTADAGLNYSIPSSTPFKLEGIGTDADDSGLTYCWEQNDPENPGSNSAPTSTRTVGPMFRSLLPVAEPYRYMPNISAIVNNTSPTFEVLPSISRSMEFSFIVRDNNSMSGCTASDLMTVNTVASAGPFLVSTPNTNVTWDTGSTETVTWDVAGTTGNGINAANVDIFLSTDGGFTYPITLALATPNDGSHDISVPNNPGTQNRIMVKASNNIFFDISNTNFTINLSSPTFLLSATPDNNESCTPTTADYTIDLTSLLGFNSPVTLSTSGLPAGAIENFSVNPVTPTNSSVLTLDPGTANFGTYIVTVSGVGGGITQTYDISYTISAGTLNTITLLSPTDGEVFVSTSPTLSWNTEANADSYEIDVATDVAFSNIIFNQTGETNMSTVASGLSYNTNYFWRVRAVNNCTIGSWSTAWQFTTQDIPACTGTIINTFPYLETFDSGIGDWTQASGDDGNWTLDANGTPSGGTGPSDDITGGGNYFFTEASSNGSPGEVGANATVILNSPCYDLSGLTEAYFSFYYHMYGGDIGTLDLEISIDDGANWNNIFTVNRDLGNQWNFQNIDLNSYLGGNVKFRFIGLTGNGWASDIAIDHIGLTDTFDPIYCDSNGNNTNEEYIGRVQLNSIDNNNLNPGITSQGYSDYTNLSTDLYSGTQYTITITPYWTGTVYNEGYAVWIDYNHDGDFDDAGEQVWTQVATQNTPVSGSFTVPDDIAFEESTRMRVSLKWNGIPTSCESFGYGEVEDYTINLKYNGLLYLNSSWIPNAPSGATGSDNALVFNGTYNVNTDVTVNNLIVNSSAAIEIPEALSMYVNGDLVNNGDLTLNSVSDQYSSLIVLGTATGDVTYNRHVNMNASSGGNDLISAPVTGQTFGAFAAANPNIFSNPSNLSEKMFGPFDKASESYLTYDTDIPSEAAVTLDSGIGYRAATSDDGTLTFKGNVNTGDVFINIYNLGTIYPEWNLIGNPYPSYIKLADFLNPTNLNQLLSTSAAIYGYNDDTVVGGKWTILNLAYSQNNPNEILTPGQGFLVSSRVGGGTITFSPGYRTIGSSDDFIIGRENQNNDIAYLSLQMASASDTYNTDFYFTDNASRGLDLGYDATVFNGVAPDFAIYSALVEENEGEDMAIQSVGYNEFSSDIVIPLGINAAQGQQITISIDNSSLPENVEVFLEDNLSNTFTLLNNSDYVFTADANLSGTGRFFLRFESETLSSPENALNYVSIFTPKSVKSIIIKGQINENTSAKLYDIQGRLVYSTTLKEGTSLNEIDVKDFSVGVYVIKLESATQGKTQKIILK